MKATHIIKSLAAMTAIAVFMAGCGSDTKKNEPANTNSLNTNKTTTPSSGSANVSSGTSTIGETSSEVDDDILDNLKAIRETQEAQAGDINDAKKASEGAESSANWAKWIGIGLAGVVGLVAITQMFSKYKAQKAREAAMEDYNSTVPADQQIKVEKASMIESLWPMGAGDTYNQARVWSEKANVNRQAASTRDSVNRNTNDGFRKNANDLKTIADLSAAGIETTAAVGGEILIAQDEYQEENREAFGRLQQGQEEALDQLEKINPTLDTLSTRQALLIKAIQGEDGKGGIAGQMTKLEGDMKAYTDASVAERTAHKEILTRMENQLESTKASLERAQALAQTLDTSSKETLQALKARSEELQTKITELRAPVVASPAPAVSSDPEAFERGFERGFAARRAASSSGRAPTTAESEDLHGEVP